MEVLPSLYDLHIGSIFRTCDIQAILMSWIIVFDLDDSSPVFFRNAEASAD